MSTTQSFTGHVDPDRIPIFINSLPDRERRIHKARRAPAPSTAPPGGPSSFPTSDGNTRSNLGKVGGLVTSGMGSRKVSFHAGVGGSAKAGEQRKRARKVICSVCQPIIDLQIHSLFGDVIQVVQSTLSVADYHVLPMTSLQSSLQPATTPLSPPRRHFQRKQGSTIRSDTLEELRPSSNVVLSPRKKPKIGDSASTGPPGEYSRPRQVDRYSATSGFNDGSTIRDGAAVQPAIKQKPYNPEEVREYMKQKRKQRKKKKGLDIEEVPQEHHHMRMKPYDAEKVRAYMQQKLLQRDLEEKAKRHAHKEKAKKTADMLDKLDLYRRQQREILRRKVETDTKRGFTFKATVHTESGDGMADSGSKDYPDSQDIAADLNERLNHDVDQRKDAGIIHMETDEAEVQKRALKRVRSNAKDVTAIAPLHRSLSAPIHKEIETELAQPDQHNTPRQAWLPQPNTSPRTTSHPTPSQRTQPNGTFQRLQALMVTAEALHQRIIRTLPNTDDDTSVTESCADQSSMDWTKEDVAPSSRQTDRIRNKTDQHVQTLPNTDDDIPVTESYAGQLSMDLTKEDVALGPRQTEPIRNKTHQHVQTLPNTDDDISVTESCADQPLRDLTKGHVAPSLRQTESIRNKTHQHVEPLPPLGDLESPPIGDKYSVINIFTRKFTIATLVAPHDANEMEATCDDEVIGGDIIDGSASGDQPSEDLDPDSHDSEQKDSQSHDPDRHGSEQRNIQSHEPDSHDSEQKDTQSHIESAYELSKRDNNPEIIPADGRKESSERFESLRDTSVSGPSTSNRMNEDMSPSQFSDTTDSSAVSSEYSTSRSQMSYSSFNSRRHSQPPRTGRRNYHRAPRRHGSTRDELLCPSRRLSPHSLSRKLMAEINLLEAIEESRIQLAELETTGRTAFAQSEAVTLTQILAERQRKHDRDLEEAKYERELKEAQMDLGAHGVAETGSQAENQRNDMYDEDFEELSDLLSVGSGTAEPSGKAKDLEDLSDFLSVGGGTAEPSGKAKDLEDLSDFLSVGGGTAKPSGKGKDLEDLEDLSDFLSVGGGTAKPSGKAKDLEDLEDFLSVGGGTAKPSGKGKELEDLSDFLYVGGGTAKPSGKGKELEDLSDFLSVGGGTAKPSGKAKDLEDLSDFLSVGGGTVEASGDDIPEDLPPEPDSPVSTVSDHVVPADLPRYLSIAELQTREQAAAAADASGVSLEEHAYDSDSFVPIVESNAVHKAPEDGPDIVEEVQSQYDNDSFASSVEHSDLHKRELVAEDNPCGELARRIELLRRQIAERKRKAKLLYQEKLQKQQTVRQRMRETEMKLKQQLEAINSIIYRTEAEIVTIGMGVELDVESYTSLSAASIARQSVPLEQREQAAAAADASGVSLEEQAYDSDSFVPIVESNDVHKDGADIVEEVQSQYDNDSFASSVEHSDLHKKELVAVESNDVHKAPEDSSDIVEEVQSQYDNDSFASSVEPSDSHKGELVAEDNPAAMDDIQNEYDSDSFVPIVESNDVHKDGADIVEEVQSEYDNDSFASSVEHSDSHKGELVAEDNPAAMDDIQNEYDSDSFVPVVESTDLHKAPEDGPDIVEVQSQYDNGSFASSVEHSDLHKGELVAEDNPAAKDEVQNEYDSDSFVPIVESNDVHKDGADIVEEVQSEYDNGSFASSVEHSDLHKREMVADDGSAAVEEVDEDDKNRFVSFVEPSDLCKGAEDHPAAMEEVQDEYDSESFVPVVESPDVRVGEMSVEDNPTAIEEVQDEYDSDSFVPAVESTDLRVGGEMSAEDNSNPTAIEEVQDEHDSSFVPVVESTDLPVGEMCAEDNPAAIEQVQDAYDSDSFEPVVESTDLRVGEVSAEDNPTAIEQVQDEDDSDSFVPVVDSVDLHKEEQDAILEQVDQDVKLDVDLSAKGLETSVDPSAEEDIVDQLLADLLDDAIKVMKSVEKQGAKDGAAPVEQQQSPLPGPSPRNSDIYPISTDTTTEQIANLIFDDSLFRSRDDYAYGQTSPPQARSPYSTTPSGIPTTSHPPSTLWLGPLCPICPRHARNPSPTPRHPLRTLHPCPAITPHNPRLYAS
ncbi:uncharacterized protein SPPG_05124 [Spizellomyces punctatus DAOM BR117]|uniref:Uncharacterized protein n=1 Tax=Spizellomyces punctatus (strain DAOM BR117) TaxID=645134 RepID=A0A0L0HFP4_SPIPD|nr:uncharacterized protein SPPG_05124 [Spizellomyces punctatus DAOM BR117]KNC99744.1 hypothetical protein SPPG_05124 [Spizellomyces punctatus DAOM BR117]|eukprot:XP_016607784.1 hypothetical protein SPPG_05124 [Spizellomyces punctatus DAOM BR117]